MVSFIRIARNAYSALKSRPLPGAAALLLLTGCVHLWAFSWCPYVSRDSVRYLTGAIRWAEQGSYDLFHFPPLPCFLMKLLLQMGFSPEAAGNIYSFLPGLFVPLASYVFALKASGNRRLARYTSVMLIGHPLLLAFSVEPLRESLFILLALLIMICGITGLKEQKLLPWFYCSVFTALAWCCRFEALEFVILAFFVLLLNFLQKRTPFRKAAAHFTVYLVCTILLWGVFTVATGGVKCFNYQFENYVLNKWNLFLVRWKI